LLKIYDSVNLHPRKIKFTPGVNLPKIKNHWFRSTFKAGNASPRGATHATSA